VLDSGLAVRPSEGRQGHDRVREGGAAIDLDVPAANLWDSHGSPPSRRQQSGASIGSTAEHGGAWAMGAEQLPHEGERWRGRVRLGPFFYLSCFVFL
jgi:hypothetical protein